MRARKGRQGARRKAEGGGVERPTEIYRGYERQEGGQRNGTNGGGGRPRENKGDKRWTGGYEIETTGTIEGWLVFREKQAQQPRLSKSLETTSYQ